MDDRLDGDRSVGADEEKVRQVVGNLVQNAIKYSPEGGEVRVVLRPTRTAIRIDVEDDGLGIAADEIAHVFEKFYRSSGHEGRSIEGTGLGLDIARELVQRMGGDLTATSTLGRGSTFSVRIPRVHESPAD